MKKNIKGNLGYGLKERKVNENGKAYTSPRNKIKKKEKFKEDLANNNVGLFGIEPTFTSRKHTETGNEFSVKIDKSINKSKSRKKSILADTGENENRRTGINKYLLCCW